MLETLSGGSLGPSGRPTASSPTRVSALTCVSIRTAFDRGGGGDRAATPGSRNPLVLSWPGPGRCQFLPGPKDSSGVPLGDGGVLTAEAIAGLPLPNSTAGRPLGV